jgi:hypothetical protein
MPTTIDSAGITFNDATTLTSAVIPANAVGATQIANGSVTAAKLGTTEQKQIAKAWVNFNGNVSSTINSSFNVSSITYVSTGQYQINFTTPLSANTYSVVGQGGNAGITLISVSQTTGYTTVGTYVFSTGTYYNGSNNIGVAIFGN